MYKSKMMENGAKQEKSTTTSDKTSTATTSSWSRLKDPRIVRVSRTFGGKDRHSKVCTVRGLRDRRVRLSVPTAIQLYDLQDRLGLNQPSKVVDWLLNVAKQEIDGLPPLQFPILTPNHNHAGFLPAKQAALKISGDFNWNDPSTKPSRVFSEANDPYNNNPPSFSSLLSSAATMAPFNSWDPSQPPISLGLMTSPQQHDQDFSHLLVYQPTHPYFPSPGFQNSDSSAQPVRPPFRFSMTADLLNNNEQNKQDDLHSS